MLETIDWSLVFVGLGALVATLLLIVEVYQAYNKYVVPKRKEKRVSEKIELIGKSENYENSRSSLERSLKEYVMTNNFTKGFYAYPQGLPSELVKRMRKWNETYERCGDWKVAGESIITIQLQELSLEYLPLTCKDYPDLRTSLSSDDFKKRYFEGVEVSKRWIEKTYPSFYEDIKEHLKDKEAKLDHFFLKLNEAFLKDRLLNRFRKEKKELIELGQLIVEDMKTEEEKIQKKLELYEGVEIIDEGIPIMN